MYYFVNERICEGGIVHLIVSPSPEAVQVHKDIFSECSLILERYPRRSHNHLQSPRSVPVLPECSCAHTMKI